MKINRMIAKIRYRFVQFLIIALRHGKRQYVIMYDVANQYVPEKIGKSALSRSIIVNPILPLVKKIK